MSEDFRNTRLWKNSLADQGECDPYVEQRERLRNAYFRFRERAALLAGEIARDLPDFTIHDVTHLDALWEMVDLVAGPDISVTPIESLALGGAFLIHDLGMALAAYPEGIDELRKEPIWLDTIAALLRQELDRAPSEEELHNPNEDIQRQAKERLLRNLHAKHAERLTLGSWKDGRSGEDYYLIENPELRRAYGTIIARIAHSHWWPVEKLGQEFNIKIGAPVGCPTEWTVDELKLACLLRVADASHLDARRAPGFLRALRRPSEDAREHWVFQGRLQKPQLEMDRLVYTSGCPFRIEEASSWWLCFDALRMLDSELRQVDALLTDLGHTRLAARGVKGVEEPERLAKLIPTEEWIPVDTRIRVTDVAALVRNLGGEQLYGQDRTVPLRELIQNASDAVRARRLIEKRPSDWGKICVRLGKDSDGDWIEVEDNGIGMSTEVLKGPLLDFGTCYWGSGLMLKEFPGLLAKGFQSTGKYGIGFFSVFMWGERVRVITRRYDAAQRETQVLEFSSGLASRPLLRKAHDSEIRRDGGTCVRVWLEEPPNSQGGLLSFKPLGKRWPLEELCAWLCPSLDVNLYVQHEGDEHRIAVSASDWISVDGGCLLRRIWGYEDPDLMLESREILDTWGNNLRLLVDPSEQEVGRACIFQCPRFYSYMYTSNGVVAAGGLRANGLLGIAGILVGTSIRTARDTALPVVEAEELARWASEQASLVCKVLGEPEELAKCASIIRACGGDTGSLPIALSTRGWMNVQEICEWENLPDEVLLLQDGAFRAKTSQFGELVVNDNVLVVAMGWPELLRGGLYDSIIYPIIFWPGPMPDREDEDQLWLRKSLTAMVIEALAKAWSSSLEGVLKVSDPPNGRGWPKLQIGMGDGGPVASNVQVIRNPRITK